MPDPARVREFIFSIVIARKDTLFVEDVRSKITLTLRAARVNMSTQPISTN